MTRNTLTILILLVMTLSLQASTTLPTSYDPTRNAVTDLETAKQLASKQGKHILIKVGGDWCIWCHVMAEYFKENPDLETLRNENYIFLLVNYSKENKNEKFLNQFPAPDGYPFLYVVDENGNLLTAQETGALESGKSYDKEKLTLFLNNWAPSKNAQNQHK